MAGMTPLLAVSPGLAIHGEHRPPTHVEVLNAKRIPTVCTFCAVGCGIIATVANGKVIDTEGDPYNPLNEGTLCPKGRGSMELINSPRRLTTPMIRTNPEKGFEHDPGWRRITWGEAFNQLGDWMKTAVESEVSRLKGQGLMSVKSSRVDEVYRFDGHEFPVGCIGSAVYNNEEAYLNRKLFTILGTNNVDHCARKCHASTVAALANTFGFGAMTNHFLDMQYAKVIIHQGGNPASAHPVAYRWLRKAKDNGAKIIVIDPRFSRSATQADIYARSRVGADAAVFLGITKYAIDNNRHAVDFLVENTNAPLLLNTDVYNHVLITVESTEELDYLGNPNLYKGVKTHAVLTTSGEIKAWPEVPPEERQLRASTTLPDGTHVETVYSKLTAVLENYTAEEVSRISGMSVAKFNEVAETFTDPENRPGTVTYAMGLTQHTNAAQLLRALCLMQLTLGNMGVPGGGVNAIRGQNNVQGATDMLVLCHLLPGYIAIPSSDAQIRQYQAWKNAGRPSDLKRKITPTVSFTWKGVNYEVGVETDNPWYMGTGTTRTHGGWRRYEKAWGIFMGTWPTNDPENGAVISDIPYNVGHPIIDADRAFGVGKFKVYFEIGDNGVVTDGGAASVYKEFTEAPGKLVVADIWETETAHLADLVFPMASVYEKNGSVSNSSRWVQYRWKTSDAPGDAKSDLSLFIKMYKMWRERSIMQLPSELYMKDHPDEEFPLDPMGRKCMEYIAGDEIWGFNGVLKGQAGRPCTDLNWDWFAEPDTDNMKASDQVYAEMDDAVGLYDGQYRSGHVGYKSAVHAYDDGRGEILAKRRRNNFRDGIDRQYSMAKNWAWCWPKNQRVLYNKDDCGENDTMNPVTFKTVDNTPWGAPSGQRSDGWAYWRQGSTFWWGKERTGMARIWAQSIAAAGKDITAAYDAWQGNKPTVPGDTFRGRKLLGPGGKPVIGLPEHFEPTEAPNTELAKDYPCYGWLYTNRNSEYEGNDKVWEQDLVGSPEEGYNVIWGSFRLTEHFHTFTRNMTLLNETQPEYFVEISHAHAEELGVTSGDYIRIESKRGWVICKVRVTKRVGTLKINGMDYHELMTPFHFGPKGMAKGSIANFVSIGTVDPHAKIPETKACMCKVMKATDDEIAAIQEKGYHQGVY
jgi:formate dehydrogenase major subunit